MLHAWWLLLLRFIVISAATARDKRQSDACAEACTAEVVTDNRKTDKKQTLATASPGDKQTIVCDLSCAVRVSAEVRYDVGRGYVFDVTSRTILKIAQERDTEVAQTAQAHISVHSPCEFSLKLTRTSLRGMDVEREWSSILERFPLRFAFDDGKVKAICPCDGDPPWAVNIKRAVLSAFQTIHEGTRETDIAGDCPVKIEKQKSGATLNLKTTKQLSACYREHDVGGVRTVPYRLQSKIQAAPMMETKQTCKRLITNHNLQRVFCTEDYRVASPTGDGVLGVLHVEQTLSAIGTAAAEPQQPFKQHLSIAFDHSDDSVRKKGSSQHAKQIIDELCQPNDHVAPDAASHFADLVYNLRGLSERELSSVSNNPRCVPFADALAACASHSCLAQLGNLINSGAAPETVYSSLSLLPSPEAGTLDSVATFIERVPLHGLLPVTSLVQSYCTAHPKCGQEPSVQRIVKSIMAKLPPGCHVGERFKETAKIVIILKSVGNIGYEEQSLPAILECVSNDRIPREVRLAAIDALRRKPCSKHRNDKITELYRDQKENTEIRIESFRQLMECPSNEILQKIVDVLHNETVNQVGSYVWSFLNTKKRSTNPGSHHLQNILKRFHTPQRYRMDPRRFSRFYEFGYFDKENNYGGHMDSSVVFTPNGYMPREVAFNFTIHLFGKSTNILEIGARVEGLEQADDELFGADGYITNPNGHVFRKRKYQSRYDKLNQLKQLYNRREHAVEDRVTATLYARVFGDDLHYWRFEKDRFLDEFKQSIELDKILAKLDNEKTVKICRHMLAFELSQTFPTLSGIPLQFLANVSVAVKLDGKLRLNLVELLRQRGNANGHINLHPSLSVARGATVLLRAGHVASGVQVVGNIHAATSMVRQMKLEGGRKFSLKIDVPHKNVFVARIHNDAEKIDSNRHRPLDSVHRRTRQAREKHYCSSDTLAKILGIKACFDAHVNLPLLEGAVKMEKVDPGLNSYQLLVERAGAKDEQKLLMSVDTPGSQVNRKMEADFELSIPRKKLKIGLTTPFKKILLDGNLQEIRRLQDYATKLKLVVDSNEYSLDGTLKVSKAGPRNSYKLDATSVAGSATTAEVQSEVQYSTEKLYGMIDFHLNKVFSKPIIFKTLLNPEAPKYKTLLQYSGPDFNGKLDGTVEHHGLIDLVGTVYGEYQTGKSPKKTLEIGLEQAFQKSGTDHHFKHAAHALSTAFNRIDFQALSDRKGNHIKNLLEATYFGKKSGANLDVTRGPNGVYTAVGTAKSDQLGVDTKANIVYQNRFPQQFTLKIDAETPKTKDLHASAEYIVKVDPKWSLNGNARLAYPGRKITLSKRIDETERGKYKMVTHLQWDPHGKIDALSDVIFRPQEHEYAIESTANVAGVTEPVTIKNYVKYQRDHSNIQWQAAEGGRKIYELNGDLRGQFGAPQQFYMDIKSDKFEPRINYHVTADIRPAGDTVTAHAIVRKDGRDFGKGDITFPKKFSLPNQKYRGEFKWHYENRPHKVVAEYARQRDPHGSIYTVNVLSDEDINLSMHLDHHDRIHFKCDLNKDRVRTVSTEFTTTPLRWDVFKANGHLNTDKPLQKRSIKAKGAFSYRPNQANVEGFLEANGKRYIAEGRWRKEPRGAGRHYIYSGKLETPQSHVHLDQQLQVEKAFTVRKAKTILELAGAGKKYNLQNEINTDDTSFTTATDLTGMGIAFKHTAEYTHRHGQRTLKKHFKYNEKEMNIDAETLYRDGEVKVNVGLSSTFDVLRSGKTSFGCRKGAVFWNCNAEGNVNDKYVIKGHEILSPENTDIGYSVTVGSLLNNEGKLKFDADNRASKYNANAMISNAGKVYNFEMSVNGDRATVKLQTPTYVIDDAQIRVVRKGPNEFELHSDGTGRGRIQAYIKNNYNDKLFKVQITGIPDSFELHLENAATDGKQKSVAELTLDPLGQKRTYGLENEIEGEREAFRAMRSTLKHPKRKMHIELLRPAQNKYSISIQPHVGGNRRATVAEMTYDKTADGYHWEGTFSDQALPMPLKAKMEYKKNERDEHNYGIVLKTEFDYSGQPEKLFSNSLHIQRSIVSPGRGKRTAAAHGDVRFVAELKSTHPASNLNTRLWAKVDRRMVGRMVIPVHTTFGLATENPQKQTVEYSLETKTDAAKFTEAQLKSPRKMMKARIDKMNDNHYSIGFYKDTEQPFFVGELNFREYGLELEFRDERTREVKFHASAQMPNDYEGKVDVWHSEEGQKTRDAQLVLQMEENNLLKGRVYFRPALEDDIMKKAKETKSKGDEIGQSSFMRDALVPIFSSHKQIANDVMGTLDSAVKEWASEQRAFAAELGSQYTILVDEVEGNYGLLKEATLVAYDQAYQTVEQFVKAIPSSDFAYPFRQLRAGGGDLRREIINALKPVSDLIDKLSKELEELEKNAAASFSRLEDTLKLKDLRKALQEYKKKFDRTDIIQTALDEARKLSRKYQMPEVERAIAGIEADRRHYESKAVEIYNKIKDLLLDKVVVSAITKVTSTLLDPLDEVEIKKSWQAVVNYLRGKITADELGRQFWRKYVPEVKRLGPGEYEMEVTVPHGATSLKELISDLHPQYFLTLKSAVAESVGLSPEDKEFAQSLLDTIYTYRPTKFDPWKMIPPFESIGYIIDGDRFISFDGRVFAFHARCEYLLASDFVNQHFALLAVFSAHGHLDAIKAELRADEVILHKNGNVQVNGASVTMPWQKIDSMDGEALISVYRKDHWTILKTYDGLRVRCNSQRDICEIVLPGRMHGRSNGLLGPNDNEPSNDRDLVDGTQNNQLNVLAEHWAVNGACRMNEAQELKHRDDEHCQAYFHSSSSSLRFCFSQVRSKPFEEICSNGGQKDHCTAASAYFEVCSNAGIDTALPHDCVKCDNGLDLDDERKIERPPTEHDVVFVVEERKCLQNHKDKIVRAAQRISQEQRSVRFGWVGFGGEGVHYEPHVHYERDDALLDVSSLIRQTQQTFEPVSGIEKPHGCVKEAVEFTTKHFPFRFASAKSVVLVLCRKCSPEGQSKMLHALLDQDVTMHVLTLSKFNASGVGKFVGMDAQQLFDERGAQVGQRTALINPNDACSVVAQQSYGTVFSLKHGSMVAASKVTPKKGSHCFNCQCTADGLSARNVCRPCEAVEPAELASYGTVDSGTDSDTHLLDALL